MNRFQTLILTFFSGFQHQCNPVILISPSLSCTWHSLVQIWSVLHYLQWLSCRDLILINPDALHGCIWLQDCSGRLEMMNWITISARGEARVCSLLLNEGVSLLASLISPELDATGGWWWGGQDQYSQHLVVRIDTHLLTRINAHHRVGNMILFLVI